MTMNKKMLKESKLSMCPISDIRPDKKTIYPFGSKCPFAHLSVLFLIINFSKIKE